MRAPMLALLVLAACAQAPASTAQGECERQAVNDRAVQEAILRANSPLQEVRVPGVRDQRYAMKRAVQRCLAGKGLAPRGGVEPVLNN